MSATVLPFKQRPVVGTAPKPAHGAHYECTTCRKDHFWVNTDLEVWCATCEKVLYNLKAVLLR